MTVTLLLTLIIECPIVAGYAIWGRKPLLPILLTSVCGNLITQSLLWLILSLFFDRYLAALIVAEIVIWILEGLLLSFVPLNQMHITQAMLLSLFMNTASLGLGWFLPV